MRASVVGMAGVVQRFWLAVVRWAGRAARGGNGRGASEAMAREPMAEAGQGRIACGMPALQRRCGLMGQSTEIRGGSPAPGMGPLPGREEVAQWGL